MAVVHFALFLLTASVIVVAGTRLARDGDIIAAGTDLGGLWVGAILVAGATSLPELSTDVSAVRQGAPRLAIGDLFGSNMANMLILAVVDLLTRHTRVLARVALTQLAVGALAICLAGIAAIGVLVAGTTIAGIGWATAGLAVAYVAGMRFLHRNRPEPPFRRPEEVEAARPHPAEVRRGALRFVLAAVLVLIAAPFLADATAGLATDLGISHAFAGVMLLAVTTSLPEAIVTMAGIRAGSYDLVVGNLLGSNCFNMAAIVVLDAADGQRSVLADAGPELVAALFGIVLTALAMLGVLDRSERRSPRIELGPIGMILVYALGIALTYRGHG